MNRYKRMFLPIFYIIDVVIIVFAFCTSYILCFGLGKPLSLPSPVYEFLLLFLTPTWLGLSLLFRTYQEEYTTPYRDHLLQFAKSQFYFLFSLFAFIVIFNLNAISRLFLAFFIVLETSLILVFHLARHSLILMYRRTGGNFRRVMLIGDHNGVTDYISNWIPEHPEIGLRLRGVLSDFELEEKSQETLRSVFAETNIDDAIVVASRKVEKLVPKLVSVADNMGIRVKIMSPYLYPVARRTHLHTLAGIPTINLRNEPLELLQNRILKRILDITVSLIILVAIHSWFIPLIGAVIRLTSKGPAVFRQKRVGKGGKEFAILKFRTMTTDHHENKEDLLNGMGEITRKNDPRVTLFGKWLRQTNIDEFPQFLNVLIGNMSLVGPRPHMVSEDIELQKNLDKYPVRRYVKPGITGWAQINGYRGGTKNMALMQKRIDHDIWYTENWSLWLDIKIMAITFWQMVTGTTKAY